MKEEGIKFILKLLKRFRDSLPSFIVKSEMSGDLTFTRSDLNLVETKIKRMYPLLPEDCIKPKKGSN